jgi:hypothetical protein
VLSLVLVAIALIILLVPAHLLGAPWNLSLAAYIRGASGDLSITSMMLLLFTWTGWPTFRIARFTPATIAWIALVFYPFALGFTMFDPYAWGYQSIIFVTAILLIATVLFFTKHFWEALILSLAVIAWSIHWHESTNLWDYLLDPFLAIWAIILSMRWMIWGRPKPRGYPEWTIDSRIMARSKRDRMFG